MSKRLQGILIGLLFAVVFSGTLTFASPELAEFFYNNIKYSITGEQLPNATEPPTAEEIKASKAAAEDIRRLTNWDGDPTTLHNDSVKATQSSDNVPQNISAIATKEKSCYDYLKDILTNHKESDSVKKIDEAVHISTDALEDTMDYLQ